MVDQNGRWEKSDLDIVVDRNALTGRSSVRRKVNLVDSFIAESKKISLSLVVRKVRSLSCVLRIVSKPLFF